MEGASEVMQDSSEIESMFDLFNELGIDVLERETEDLPATGFNTSSDNNEEDGEESDESDILSTIPRTQEVQNYDLVSLYIRDVSAHDLLTREDEVELAKRIEQGLHQATLALASCPAAVTAIVELIGRIEAGEIQLSQIIMSGEEDTEESLHERFERLRSLHHVWCNNLEGQSGSENESDSDDVRQSIADQLASISFAPEYFDKLVKPVHDLVQQVIRQERSIRDICINQLGIDRKIFLAAFRGNETNQAWVEDLGIYLPDRSTT
jgi:RNA polymerase primary sigma factor